MIPIGGLLLVIIAAPPNRIELLNRRLLHTSRDGEEHLPCDQHRLYCSVSHSRSVRDGHSSARATRGKPGGRTGIEVSWGDCGANTATPVTSPFLNSSKVRPPGARLLNNARCSYSRPLPRQTAVR